MKWFKTEDDPLAEDFVKEIRATVPWLLAAAIAVAGYYGVKNYRASRRAAAPDPGAIARVLPPAAKGETPRKN